MAATLACDSSLTASARVEGLVPIEPRPAWREIYREVESCTGTPGDFDRVEWFEADRIDRVTGEPSGGAWLIAQGMPHGIALLDDLLERSPAEIQPVVRHEVIHEVLQLADHGDPVWCECDDRPELFSQCQG